MKIFKFRITYAQRKNPSKSFDLVPRTISVGHICFDINALKKISQLVFTATHPFFTYQNIFLRVENIQFYTKKSLFATKIVIFWQNPEQNLVCSINERLIMPGKYIFARNCFENGTLRKENC